MDNFGVCSDQLDDVAAILLEYYQELFTSLGPNLLTSVLE